MSSAASQITCGDLDGEGKGDLVGIWPSQGGVWVKYSGLSTWDRLSSTADWIACGDMNGDGLDDLLGSWSGQGVYYRDTASGKWYKTANPASQVVGGDLDGDCFWDLVGIWSGQGGVWVKYSGNSSWQQLSSTADWISCGKMKDSGNTSQTELLSLQPERFESASGPPVLYNSSFDFSSNSPGGKAFTCSEQPNLHPIFNRDIQFVPGPGDPGFVFQERQNLIPREVSKKNILAVRK